MREKELQCAFTLHAPQEVETLSLKRVAFAGDADRLRQPFDVGSLSSILLTRFRTTNWSSG
jgi:hypothetical protein